jgi:hypothetical protein
MEVLVGPSGDNVLRATFDFGPAGKQKDEFVFSVLPKRDPLKLKSRIALFDPKGMTAKVLDSLAVKYDKIDANADTSKYNIVILGREAIGLDTKLPDVAPVRNGLKVLVFEQTAETLSHRLGFRVQEHGLRQVFGSWGAVGEENNWRGSSTLVPSHLPIEGVEKTDPKWRWCAFENTRVWRCGNRGCVASVLIEKPPIGDFLAPLGGGFDLQYAPLLICNEGKGKVVFCQFDVTGRTDEDPAAMDVCRTILRLLDKPQRREPASVLYDGDDRGRKLLDRLGIAHEPYSVATQPGQAEAEHLVVLGPGAEKLKAVAEEEEGANVVALGLSGKELSQLLDENEKVTSTVAYSDQNGPGCRWISPGVTMADLSWRTRLTVDTPLYEGGEPLFFEYCGGCFAFQVVPWMFDFEKKPYLRTTYRRNVYLVSRLLHNLGAPAKSPLLERLARPAGVNELVLTTGWVGQVDKQGVGRKAEWWRAEFDDSKWRGMKVPGYFEDQIPELADYDGLFWYRLRFKLPAGMTREKLALALGPVDDESWVWLNGKFLGEVTKQTNPKDYWAFPRRYAIEPGMINATGENVLVVLVNDIFQKGGITGTPALTAPGAWLNSFYLDEPVAGDDPYRYYRW